MRIRIDPRRCEIKALKETAGWRDMRVLDIGCGDGRLTLRLASLGAIVTGIDPDKESIREARKGLPRRLAGRVRYRVGSAEQLAFPSQSFDRVVYSWSL